MGGGRDGGVRAWGTSQGWQGEGAREAGPGRVGLVRISITVKLDGVDGGGDGAPSVAATLLLGLLVAEGLALGEPQDIVGLLAPVAASTHLTDNKQLMSAL